MVKQHKICQALLEPFVTQHKISSWPIHWVLFESFNSSSFSIIYFTGLQEMGQCNHLPFNLKLQENFLQEQFKKSHVQACNPFSGDLRRLRCWRSQKATEMEQPKQITYRQYLPKVCVQQFHGKDKFYFKFGSFGSFWIYIGQGYASEEFVKFANLRKKIIWWRMYIDEM